MTVWVLFVWLGTMPLPASYTYDSKKDCEEAREIYKRAACVAVKVARPA